MSMRSIIEINHDFAYKIREEPEFQALLSNALTSGADRLWDQLRGFGVQRVVMVHHSTDRKVVAHGTEFPIG